jgi:hypothetical protein
VSIKYYTMEDGQEAQVAILIHGLIASYGTDLESKLTPASLRESAGFLNVEVADQGGKIVGVCAWTLSFSTWRGVRGMHIADHITKPGPNAREIAEELLRYSAIRASAQGARFIRTEVDVTDELLEHLYADIGFYQQTRHTLHFLEPSGFAAFTSRHPAKAQSGHATTSPAV